MTELPICAVCGKPIDVNREAHITEQDGTVKHAPCPIEQPADQSEI